jgi:hypothetical protein
MEEKPADQQSVTRTQLPYLLMVRDGQGLGSSDVVYNQELAMEAERSRVKARSIRERVEPLKAVVGILKITRLWTRLIFKGTSADRDNRRRGAHRVNLIKQCF